MKKIISKAKPSGPKKGKTKASVHKASLQKLANKKTSRLAKQGKLNKGDKKKKKWKARQEEANKESERQAQLSAVNSNEEEESDSGGEESAPEEVEYFRHLQNARGFASMDLNAKESHEPKGKKRKRTSDDEEEDYERQPRTFLEDKNEQNMKMMLPIISKGKVIKRMMEKEKDEPINGDAEKATDQPGDGGAQGEENGTEDKAEEEVDERAYLASLNSAQQFAYCQSKLAEKKQKIASLSQNVLEDPQNNMAKLKELRLLLGSQDPGIALSVRKYAMVSIMEVFKDIVPGYRLRIPTEKERTQRVKKETKTLWDYEASFLLNYKIYLEFLELMAKRKPIAEKTFLTKHGITNLKLSKPAAFDLGKLALRCLCEMLTNHPHFNYRDNVIVSISPFTNHKRPEYNYVACEAVKTVFKQDRLGDVTLEVVRAIGKMVKQLKFDVKPQVLETFLVLKIKEVDMSGSAATTEKMKRKEKMMKYSRRERKRLKQKEQLDKELLETKASADKHKKLRLHTEVIQAVFETYIRVIKLSPDSALLPAVLEGLAKFAHLINIEYFDSLFAALNGLIESGNLTTRESLHCMQTAFTILSGQGSVLNIDPARFYKHFYCNLVPVHAGETSETVPVVLQCLDVMISKRRKQVSQQRILAFIKRLTTISLQQNPEAAIALLAAVRQFVHSYKYSDLLFDNDIQGSGVYLPYLEDPEHCCANSASLWELHLLRHHYNPAVQLYSRHMIQKAPLAGQHQLPQHMTRKSPIEIYEEMNSRDVFHSVPEKCPKKKRRRADSQPLFLDYLRSVSKEAAQVLAAEREELPVVSEGMDTS
ncbi:nucleolar complex protein 3 homolog [Aplysia californica]|uniref:Nucleolar complex protein 3 homolog n=1 Tax=Aplysia californica TaxID=6500 RepID=A0ABM0JB82_APLCA|nr:nucleolar complex protein 3 homolog [Aplysia californica]